MRNQHGTSTLMILVFMLVFATILAASLSFIASQSNKTVDQEQEEQAFGLADAGVNYTMWLLSDSGAGYSPEELYNNPPNGATNHEVFDENDVFVGTFSVQFLEANDTLKYLKIRSTGLDQAKHGLCQVIEAELNALGKDRYRTTRWDHLPGYPCDDQIAGCNPYSIELGQAVDGELTENDCSDQYVADVESRADLYTWDNSGGSRTVQLNLTTPVRSFAPYLTFRDPSGGDLTYEFSPSGPGWVDTAWAGTDRCDDRGACIAQDGNGVDVSENGEYQIEVAWNGRGNPDTGLYTLEFVELFPVCDDGIDNDGDGETDFPNDPGCDDEADESELSNKQCDNGIDDDLDSFIDFGEDPECGSLNDNNEAPDGPG